MQKQLWESSDNSSVWRYNSIIKSSIKCALDMGWQLYLTSLRSIFETLTNPNTPLPKIYTLLYLFLKNSMSINLSPNNFFRKPTLRLFGNLLNLKKMSWIKCLLFPLRRNDILVGILMYDYLKVFVKSRLFLDVSTLTSSTTFLFPSWIFFFDNVSNLTVFASSTIIFIQRRVCL